MSEPKFGFTNVRKAKRDGKIKGYFDVIIATEGFGGLVVPGFKVIKVDSREPFLSFPSRPVPMTTETTVETTAGKMVTGKVKSMKYFNTIRFESYAQSQEFNEALQGLAPRVLAELRK